MGLFRKKDKKKEVPSLPELPKLPDFPRLEDEGPLDSDEFIHQLPGFPSNSLGKKFSQDSIKDAVTGKKDVDGSNVDELDIIGDMRRIQEPLRKPRTREIHFGDMDEEDIFMGKDVGVSKTMKGVEPVFIRIDRFEEGLHIFEDTKKKISEIERVLGETKRIKEKEERELQDWEGGIASCNFCSMGKEGTKCAEIIEKNVNAFVRGTKLDEKNKPKGKCVICKKPAREVVYVAKSY